MDAGVPGLLCGMPLAGVLVTTAISFAAFQTCGPRLVVAPLEVELLDAGGSLPAVVSSAAASLALLTHIAATSSTAATSAPPSPRAPFSAGQAAAAPSTAGETMSPAQTTSPPVGLPGAPSAGMPAGAAQLTRWHFMTFGSGKKYKNSVNRICKQARGLTHRAFESAVCLNSLTESVASSPKFEAVRHKQRGFGYWHWKPALILERLGQIPDGDVLVWADAGNTLRDVRMWDDLASVMRGVDVIAIMIGHPDAQYTKGDIFKRFQVAVDSQYGTTRQICATFLFVKNSPGVRKLVGFWEDLVADAQLVTDARSISPNSKSFRENRHDQSLFSMLIKANEPSMPSPTAGGLARCVSCPAEPWSQPRHPEFGVPGLKVAVVKDFSWPPNNSAAAISATRMRR